VNTLALLALALADPTSQIYAISLDGNDVGYAELGVERPASNPKKGTFKYTWTADLMVSGDPCLRSHEETSGSAKVTDATLPEELFVALAGEIGPGCKSVRSGAPGPSQKKGKGCWTDASFENATGTLFDSPIEVTFAPNLMPSTVKYKELGITYRQVAEVSDELKECKRTAADDGIEAPGAKGIAARKLTHAVFETTPSAAAEPADAEKTEVKVVRVALPAGVKEIIADRRSEELSSCQLVAEGLIQDLTAKGHVARGVVGLLLDDGRYYPHAWVEVKVGKEWVALDATTSDGAADAGRFRVGPMGEMKTGLDLLKLLHAPPKLVVHE
jgi:hypothetical protein